MGYTQKWLFPWPDKQSCFGDFVILVFLIVQCLDGVLTYVGVSVGLALEGNQLINRGASVVGFGFSIVAAKFVSVGLGIFINQRGPHVLLALTTIVCLILGVIPWLRLFLTY